MTFLHLGESPTLVQLFPPLGGRAWFGWSGVNRDVPLSLLSRRHLGKGGRKRGIPMNALESRRREKEISGMGIPAKEKTGWKRKRERKVAEKPYQTKKIPCKMSRNNSNSTFESRAVLVLVPPELLFHVWSTCFV